jgi:DNA-binding NarL/FixJ family response regulator
MSSPASTVRVLVVDDHPIVRYGLERLIAGEADLVVCGEAVDAPSALDALATTSPDVIVVDITLGATSGIDLIRDIKQRAPAVRVLVVSIHDELLYAERALRAGAVGYVMKHEAVDKMVRAIRTVASGGMFLSEDVSNRLVQRATSSAAPLPASPLEALTDRELHVLQLLGRGLGTRAIAEQLHVSIKTIESYRARLKDKMKLRSGTELVRFAVQWAEDKGQA